MAPFDGVLLPLEQVPDPVFAQKMVGDGISIDPLGDTLCAPCGCTVSQLHRAGHAVTLTTPKGFEVMLHIGLDTVMLKGEGYSAHVSESRQVATGDPPIGRAGLAHSPSPQRRGAPRSSRSSASRASIPVSLVAS